MTPMIYKPFPVDALPRVLASFVDEGADALGCDPSMIALPTIAVVGSLIGNTRTIRLKNSWHEPTVFWCCVVADSGTLKSPAFDLAIRPPHQLQNKLRVMHAEQLRTLAEERNAWSAAKACGEEVGEAPPADPSVPRVVCSDTTIEKLGELLAENSRGILCARDELAGWFGSFTMYKSGATDLPRWLEMSRAGHLTIDRKTGEKRSLFVDRAAVSVCGTIQPGILADAVSGDFIESGLVARLLLAMPPKQRKQWRDVDIDPATVEKFERLLEQLHSLDFGTNGRGQRVPIALRLDADARRAWVHFYDEWAARQHDAEDAAAASLSKLEGYAARFAAMHHIVSRVSEGIEDAVPIQRESVESGITLCRWFANEAERVYASFSETASERDQRRLFDFIASRGGEISPRDLQRWNAKRYPKVDDAAVTLNDLAAAGAGNWQDVTLPNGRRTRRFRLGARGGDAVPPDDNSQSPDDKSTFFPQKNENCHICHMSHEAPSASENDANDPDFDGHGDAFEPPPPNGAKLENEEAFPFGHNLPQRGGDDESPFNPQVEAPSKPGRCTAYSEKCDCAECRCERAVAQREKWGTRTPRAKFFSF